MTNFSVKCLKSEKIKIGTTYGQFLINCSKFGQGITIGNLLRRVLLSDLGGIAITAARIAGVNHEFSTIKGLREDILELLLNLKGIILKGKITEACFGRLKIQESTVITASLIELPSGLEIVNPNHYIATSISSNLLEIELKFEYGTGYKLATQIFNDKLDDFLQMDAIFMPIQKVDFKVENIYDNSNKTSEHIMLDIWTNGSITPEDAIIEAIKLIINLLSSLLNNNFKPERKKQNTQALVDPHTNIAIEELQLSVRAYNCLKRVQINTIADLLKYSPEQLQELKNFGRKSADEVFITLKNKLGIVLK